MKLLAIYFSIEDIAENVQVNRWKYLSYGSILFG